MKKKLISVLLSTAMVATALTGCGGSSETATTETKTEATETKTETKTEATAEGADTEAAATEGAYAGELEIMHFSTSEESQGNGGSDGFRTVLTEWDEAHPDITLTQNVRHSLLLLQQQVIFQMYSYYRV